MQRHVTSPVASHCYHPYSVVASIVIDTVYIVATAWVDSVAGLLSDRVHGPVE